MTYTSLFGPLIQVKTAGYKKRSAKVVQLTKTNQEGKTIEELWDNDWAKKSRFQFS